MNCKEFVGQLIELETTLSIHSHSVCNDVQKIERELFEPKCEFELYIRFFKFYKYGNKEMVIGVLLHILLLNRIETVMAGMEPKFF